MAWIEVHQSLPSHRKTRKLARLLGLKPPGGIPQAIGHMVMLWLWCVDNAQSGDISNIDKGDIADAAGWTRDPDVFVRALTDSGFLDTDGMIHDWGDHAGKLVMQIAQRKAGNRSRQQKYRDNKKRDNVLPIGVTYGEHNTLVTRYATVTSRVTDNARNGAKEPSPLFPSPAPLVPPPPHTPSPPYNPPVTPPKHPPQEKLSREDAEELFGEFWGAYPRKTAKANALKSWLKIKPDKPLAQRIILAVREQAKSPQWTRDDGQYIPHPATWLNQRRWEDETEPSPSALANPYDKTLF